MILLRDKVIVIFNAAGSLAYMGSSAAREMTSK
jgi:hypothetical protein